MQSDFSGCFEPVADDLRAGKAVLVTGTPCQIAAMKKYVSVMNVPADRLFLADIICHGIPSMQFFRDYRQWLEQKYGSTVAEYRFRDKRISWRGHSCSAELADGRRIENTRELCSFMNVYYSGNITGESCFECKYATVKRQSDITISDYWGVEDFAPEFEDKLGVSMILVNSEKGRELLSSAEGACIEGELAVARQPQLSGPCSRPDTLDTFMHDYYAKDTEYLLKKYGGLNLSKKSYLKKCLYILLGKQ